MLADLNLLINRMSSSVQNKPRVQSRSPPRRTRPAAATTAAGCREPDSDGRQAQRFSPSPENSASESSKRASAIPQANVRRAETYEDPNCGNPRSRFTRTGTVRVRWAQSRETIHNRRRSPPNHSSFYAISFCDESSFQNPLENLSQQAPSQQSSSCRYVFTL